jgi:hypothetical protein
MIDNNKIDVSHITKFDVQYFYVWKHIIALMFKQKKVWQIVVGTKAKPITPTTTQIIKRTLVLPTTWANNISDWVECNNLVFPIKINIK